MATAWFNAIDKTALSFLLCRRKARQPCKVDWKYREKEKGSEHSSIPALPLHRVCTRADGHMGDATFFKGSEANSWPSPSLPRPRRSQIARSNVSPPLYQTSPLSANSWGTDMKWLANCGTSRLWMSACVCFLDICSRAVVLAVSLFNMAAHSQTHSPKNQYSFAWAWPKYSKASGCLVEVIPLFWKRESVCVYGENVCLCLHLWFNAQMCA